MEEDLKAGRDQWLPAAMALGIPVAGELSKNPGGE
jgi:hypothetical protein